MFSCAGDVTIEPSPHGYLAGIDCLRLGSVFVGKPLRPSHSKPSTPRPACKPPRRTNPPPAEKQADTRESERIVRVSHVFSVTNRRVMGFAGLGCCVMIVHDRDDQKEREDGFPQCVLPFFDHMFEQEQSK